MMGSRHTSPRRMAFGSNDKGMTNMQMTTRKLSFMTTLFAALFIAFSTHAVAMPKTIAYSAFPNGYFNEHAADVAKIYDGFFFVVGSWDEGVLANIGLGNDSPPSTDWAARVRENVKNLNKAGVTENLLGVAFNEEAQWPSAETLLSKEYTDKMVRHFSALGKTARDFGFRGVSIDIEYCYKRYEFGNEIYKYDGYTAEDLVRAADKQGRAIIQAVLDAFPDAVVFTLPGELQIRPIGRAFLLGMLSGMAERDAPGGLHLGYERSYCLWDGPISQLAIPETANGAAELLLTGRNLKYWKTRCDVAPGVWPLHMIETGAKDYPIRPWPEEMAELKQQMKLLRAVAKSYIWSFTSSPIWYAPKPDLEKKYGLNPLPIDNAAEVVKQWHEILEDKTPGEFDQEKQLMTALRQYHNGRISFSRLCDRFGTPADWMLLGPLANPFTQPAYASPVYSMNGVDSSKAQQGRDSAVHWFPFHNYDPMGAVSLRAAFDWLNTDNSALQAVTLVKSRHEQEATLHFGWDDGAVVWLNDAMILDKRSYPENGHGMQFCDRYLFEEHVPIIIPKGTSLLRVSSINLKGIWGFALQITDRNNHPIKDLEFSLPKSGS
jgi:hypothetical protein